jgi:hypothetical protein
VGEREGELVADFSSIVMPRGRQGGRRKHDSELLDRIAKLETLVKRIEQGPAGSTPTVPAAEAAAADGSWTV